MVLENVQRMRARFLRGTCAVALLAAAQLAAGTGCGAEDAVNPLPGDSSGTSTPEPEPEPEACEPGATRHCTVPIGTQDGIISCIDGNETCGADRGWGECEGRVRSGTSPRHIPDGATRELLTDPTWLAAWKLKMDDERLGDVPGATLRDHTADTSTDCLSPCDPDCQEFPDPIAGSILTPGDVSDADPLFPSLDDLLGFISTAGGLYDKLLGDGDDCEDVADCNGDTYCGAGALLDNGCSAWLGTEFDADLAGPDLTIGIGCGEPLGSDTVYIPLCNRGGEAYVGNATVHAYPSNSNQIPGCNPAGTGGSASDKSCTIAVDLDPGECMRLPNECHSTLSGNNKAFVVDRGTSGAGANLGSIDEGETGGGDHDCNNWGFWRKQDCGGACGVEVGPWACDDPEENDGGCESDCEVRFHTGADAADGLLEEYWENYVGFGQVRLGGVWQDMAWVWDEDGCTSGNQYYLEPVNSGEDHFHLELCPALCAVVDDATTEFEFEFACYTFDETFAGSVAYQGECPTIGTRVTWQYAGWNAVTPGDTSIVFEVRTASTHADLASAAWLPLGDVSANGDSPSCLFDDPDPECPVSLFDALGGAPDVTNEYIEIRYTLYSGSDGLISPALYDLQVSYTCPDTE